jgi:hypothetical protein
LGSAKGSPPPLAFKTVLATFAAHGSSVDGALIMSTYPLGEFLLSTVYLVVTVTVNRRRIVIPVVAVIAIEVMDLNRRWRREDESTSLAASLLEFK